LVDTSFACSQMGGQRGGGRTMNHPVEGIGSVEGLNAAEGVPRPPAF